MKKSVLVIDDSPDMLALERMILKNDGFEVFTAQSGTAAFRLLTEMPDPNLIILDQQMEDMSGDEFLDRLEEYKPGLTSNVPVVILSGSDPTPHSKAAGYIRKFPDIKVFLEHVHQFMGSRA